jgi:long-chain acyl-CoA synthetase
MRVFERLIEASGSVAAIAAALPAPRAAARLALVGPPSADLVRVAMAATLRGFAVGMLDPSWTNAETRGALASLVPQVVIAGSSLTTVLVDAEATSPAQRDEVIAAAARISGSDAFYIGFTSGSSGRPKGFVRSHRSWWESFVGFDALFAIGGDDRVLVPGPLASSHFFFGALHALHARAGLDVLAAFDADVVIDRILAGATRAYVVPTMLERIVVRADDRGINHLDVASIFCAGARLEPSLRERVEALLPGGALVEYYGASELSFVSIHRSGTGIPRGSVGRAFPGVRIDVLGDDAQPVPVGAEGTIYVTSDLVFSGYLEPTDESTLHRVGDALTVGDRGHLDIEGNLFVAGRGSSLIITGGSNVQAEEVELTLAAAPGVAAAVVFGLADPRWGEVVAAAIVPAVGFALDRRTLRAHMRTHLAPHKRPRRYFMFAGSMPLTAAGKLARDEVRAAVDSGRLTEL